MAASPYLQGALAIRLVVILSIAIGVPVCSQHLPAEPGPSCSAAPKTGGHLFPRSPQGPKLPPPPEQRSCRSQLRVSVCFPGQQPDKVLLSVRPRATAGHQDTHNHPTTQLPRAWHLPRQPPEPAGCPTANLFLRHGRSWHPPPLTCLLARAEKGMLRH